MTILQSLLCYVIGWSINFTLLGTIKGFKDSRKTALISLAWPVVLPAMGIVIGYKVWFQHQTELESKTEAHAASERTTGQASVGFLRHAGVCP
jgi:hypothetical protein